MSKYSEISKLVGWEGPMLPIPDVEVVKHVTIEIMSKNEDALFAIFKWNRFCESPTTIEEIESINLITRALSKGREIFNN